MHGHSQLNATVTKAVNDATPEAIFRTGTANSTIQYFNVEANTTYSFDGFIQMTKTLTPSTVSTSILYYSGTSGVTVLGEQSARLNVQYLGTSAQIGVGSVNATATAAVSPSTALTAIYCYFRGLIVTNSSTAGRIGIAQWVDTAGATAPQWVQGSYINIYKIGATNSGSVQTFGNWS